MAYDLSKTALILFLCTGITLAAFSMDGNNPDEKDRLNISASSVEISFLIALKFGLESYLDKWICRYLAKILLSLLHVHL